MKFLDWYLKIAAVSALVGASMELFMVHTGFLGMKFLVWYLKIAAVSALVGASMELFMVHIGFYNKVTVLESEKRAWESSPEAQAVKEALNPWRKLDEERSKS